jgi:asparagine synthase (glutamine-hydrolysing)
MCGIAGAIDLVGQREPDPRTLARMAAALRHRGPDEEGLCRQPAVGLAARRLSIVGLADSQQPIFNEDRSVCVVYNGEIFDYIERRADLTRRGHRFRTSGDTEVLVHLWEEFGEEMLTHLHGQFAFALYDVRKGVVILARDRVGICPLHWARRGEWLYFGSEIKAILASGQVEPEPDPRGIDHIFTFFGMGTRRTAFRDISSLHPGSYMKVRLGGPGESAAVSEHLYWDLDFPDRGAEFAPKNPATIVDEFRQTFFRAVELRLRADVPVVGYLSGGVDSSCVLAAAAQVGGKPIDAFTVRIDTSRFDESRDAIANARDIGCRQTIITCDTTLLSRTYPDLIRAADCPVVDTSCAALYRLAEEVHNQGFKVALTGEGADEALAGYPWFKTNKLMGLLDTGRFRPSDVLRRAI